MSIMEINSAGLKDHSNSRQNLVFYTPVNPPPGSNRLTVNLQSIRPEHFEGIIAVTRGATSGS